METKSPNHVFENTVIFTSTNTCYAPAPIMGYSHTLLSDDEYEDVDIEPIEFYATPEQIVTLQCQSVMKSALKISGSVLAFAFVSVFVLWWHLVFELNSTSTLQNLAILGICLVQTSIFANTLIVLASVIYGKLNGQLQILITPTSTNKTCREGLLFLDALCQGSYKASLFMTVAMIAAMGYHYFKAPLAFDAITIGALVLFFIGNLISMAVIKAAHTKVKAALLIVKKEG